MFDETSKTAATNGSTRRPRFVQIVDEVRLRTVRAELTEQATSPSEHSLAEQSGVSRMTARRALEALESEGSVYNKDRHRRFVSTPRLRYKISEKTNFVADAQSEESDFKTDVIHVGSVKSDARLAGLQEQPDGTLVHQYTKLFYSGGHAVFIEAECVLSERFPGLLERDLRQSTTLILETPYNTESRYCDVAIRMRAIREDEAKLLNISTSHAEIELEQFIRDQAGSPFYFGRQIWRGETAEFSARAILTRGDGDAQ